MLECCLQGLSATHQCHEEGPDGRAQAAFGAPIGGVLFSMEEACTHWSRKVAVRCFVCTTVAVCTVGLLNPKCAPWEEVQVVACVMT